MRRGTTLREWLGILLGLALVVAVATAVAGSLEIQVTNPSGGGGGGSSISTTVDNDAAFTTQVLAINAGTNITLATDATGVTRTITITAAGGGAAFSGDVDTTSQKYLNNAGTAQGGAVQVRDALALATTSGTANTTVTASANTLAIDVDGVGTLALATGDTLTADLATITAVSGTTATYTSVLTTNTTATNVFATTVYPRTGGAAVALRGDTLTIGNEAATAATIATLTPTANTLTLGIAGTGTLAMASGDGITADLATITTVTATTVQSGGATLTLAAAGSGTVAVQAGDTLTADSATIAAVTATSVLSSGATLTLGAAGSGTVAVQAGDTFTADSATIATVTATTVQSGGATLTLAAAGAGTVAVQAGDTFTSPSGTITTLASTTFTATTVSASGSLLVDVITALTVATPVMIRETNGIQLETDAGAATSTIVPSTNLLTVNVDGIGTLELDSGDTLALNTIIGNSGAIDINETSGISLAIDNGTVPSTIVPASTLLTINVDGTGTLVLNSGDKLSVNAITGNGGSVNVNETSGLIIASDAGANPATFFTTASTLSIDVPGTGGTITTDSGVTLQVDNLASATSGTTITIAGTAAGGVSVGTEPFSFSNLSGGGGADAVGDIPVRVTTGGVGIYTRLPAGSTAGHVLTSNGSAAAPTYQAQNATNAVTYVSPGFKGLSIRRTSATQVNISWDELTVVNSGRTLSTALPANASLTADITVSGAGGLDTGAEAGNTHYFIYAIKSDSTGLANSLLSASATSPTLPANHTQFRLIGWVRNDGSSNFKDFYQRQDRCFISTFDNQLLAAGADTSYTDISITSFAPSIATVVTLNVFTNSTGTGLQRLQVFFRDPTNDFAIVAYQFDADGVGGSPIAAFSGDVNTDGAKIEYKVGAADDRADVYLMAVQLAI